MSEPYIEDGCLCEPCEPDYAPGISQAIPGSWSKPLVDLTELDGWDELIAAAEQRGAVKALRGAANLSRACWAANKNLADPDNPEVSYSFDRWLEVRADRLEGDE